MLNCIDTAIMRGEYSLIMATPESSVSPFWIKKIKALSELENVNVCLMAVDEAHVVALWYINSSL